MKLFYKFGSKIIKKTKMRYLYALNNFHIKSKIKIVEKTGPIIFPSEICRNVIGIDVNYLQQESNNFITLFLEDDDKKIIGAIVFSINKSNLHVYALCTQATGGFGTLLINIIIHIASSLIGIKSITLSAIESAVGFYKKKGFTQIGEPYPKNVYTKSALSTTISSSSDSSSSDSSSSDSSYSLPKKSIQIVRYYDMSYEVQKSYPKIQRTLSHQKLSKISKNSTRRSKKSI
jgi:hypothetical protein